MPHCLPLGVEMVVVELGDHPVAPGDVVAFVAEAERQCRVVAEVGVVVRRGALVVPGLYGGALDLVVGEACLVRRGLMFEELRAAVRSAAHIPYALSTSSLRAGCGRGGSGSHSPRTRRPAS